MGKTLPTSQRSTKGTHHVVALFAKFKDEAPGVVRPPEYARTLFDPEVEGSFSHFYRTMSREALTIQGACPVKMYASEKPPSDYTATGDEGAFGLFNREVLRKADEDVDFGQFDNDGPDGIPNSGDDDGLVDALFFIHAGPGQESTGEPSDIWSHAWALWSPQPTDDGVSIYRYSVEPEEHPSGDLITVGVFCHEYGHVLGLPDLYDTDGSSGGIGEYGMMSGGSWCHRDGDLGGSRPCQFTAWSKWQLGWLDPVTITTDQIGLVLPAAALNAVAYRVWRSGNPPGNQYFLLENRQNVGFDDALVRRQVHFGQPLSHGLVIYRINDDQPSNSNDSNRLVDVVDASPWFHPDGTWHETLDGPRDSANWHNLSVHTRGDNGDPWPGFTLFSADSTEWYAPRDRDRFADDTAPPATDLVCEPTGIALENIQEVGQDVVLDVTLATTDVVVYTPAPEPLIWDFETDTGDWEFCNTHAHHDLEQGDDCSGQGGIWFGQTGWDNCDGVGYGNNWDDPIRITVAVNHEAPVALRLDHRYETEPSYDYCYVEVRPAVQTAPWTTLAAFEGILSSRTDEWTIPQSVLDAAPVHADPLVLIQVRLRLESDGAWSGEDGFFCGVGWWIDRIEIEHRTITEVGDLPDPPKAATLALATPNPFNPSTNLSYRVPSGARSVRLDVFDERGRLVRTLVSVHPGAGWQSVRWDGRDGAGRMVASGSYVARLVVDGAV
ncbi:MAG: M6 family metalloprotease domain-containing protein, partial [Candidatus Latescibacteria bacterium]|nr:M6 family metalloprotease domain-containing protein [Candidatus Latescibacterota bacterium]